MQIQMKVDIDNICTLSANNKCVRAFGNRNRSVLLVSFSFLFQCEYKYIFVISRQCMGFVFKLHHVSKIKTFCYFGYIFYGESTPWY